MNIVAQFGSERRKRGGGRLRVDQYYLVGEAIHQA
jgi:hypothetical protein